MNYEQDIQIDETALDVEWLEQPRLMLAYTQNAAEARRMLDLAKEKIDLVRAELDKEIRLNPDTFGIEKVTEGAINAVIITQQRYIDANTEAIQAKFEAEVAQGAVRAFEQRKDALENLVKLHGQQYFAGPSVPRNLSKERDAHRQQTNIETASKMTVRRRTT